MSGDAIVHTVLFDTRDAVTREEGRFTFKLGGDNPRFQAVKVALGSLEFPIVQYSIEERANRLYYSEGYRFVRDDSRVLQLREQIDDHTYNEIVVTLPLHLNDIADVDGDARGTIVTTAAAHGLWIDDGRKCMIPAYDWADVQILCAPIGRVSLTELYDAGRLRYLSPRQFIIVGARDALGGGGGILHAPACPSPESLAALVSHALTFSDARATYDCAYDARENRATIRATAYPPGAKKLTLTLYGSKLAKTLGYPSAMHERAFVRREAPDDFQPYVATQDDLFGDAGDVPPLRLPSDPFSGWHYVTLPAGWYTPSQRPMCTGQPLRLNQEIESAMNRLNFPVPERIPSGMATAHFLMFADPCGDVHNLPVYAGRYTATQFSEMLEAEMTRLSADSGAVFAVEYDADAEGFVFQCEVREGGVVKPAPFSLLFDHPAQFDPSRLGFSPVALHDRDTYASNMRVALPSATADDIARPCTNVYRVREIGHQKKLSVHAAPPTKLTGKILAYDRRLDTLTVQTYAGQLPYAHGLVAGDVVRFSSAGGTSEVYAWRNGTWALEKVPACPIAPSWCRIGVVVATSGVVVESGAPACAGAIELSVRVRPTRDMVDHIGQLLCVHVAAEAFNLCFELPKSVPHVSLGFPRGATQWGADGSVLSGRLRIPPFDAPRVHALDHPDYVLIYFADGKMSTNLQHQYGATSTTPFAKLVLYPMFREERMLPRETMLLSGESLSMFTILFKNPDGSPYSFHGAEFSFSLNFIRVPPPPKQQQQQ